MEISDAQKAAITQWIQEGRSLADVQRSLREAYEISMTYMDAVSYTHLRAHET